MKIFFRLSLLLMLSGIFSCSEGDTDALFRVRKAHYTGIDFVNTVQETENFNILNYEYLYNGSGVGIGDVNNDGLPDLFFAGNMSPNRLYLNKGNLKFEDITETAGIAAPEKWCTGIAVADVNADGWLDIYVGAATYGGEKRANLLFINNGTDQDGIPSFTESAAKYGVADEGNTMGAAFLDYDNDGDLDLYVLANEMEVFSPNKYRPKKNDGSSPTNDKLYRNNGNGTFSDVSREAGIRYEGYGLGIHIFDINDDGWSDIYVSNDYLTNDLLYVNQGDGTFENQVWKYFKHQTHSAMGNDVADINNDALPDIVTLDMLPGNHYRQMKMLPESKFSNYRNNEIYGYQYQYMRNTLQLNRGQGPDGQHVFSEIGIFAGIHATEWSWTPLLVDLDNDGWRDLIVTNGFPKDIMDQDYSDFRGKLSLAFDKEKILANIPEVEVPNMVYRNNGDLTFSDLTREWGLSEATYSNGAAYGDLDQDGDLDMVINNINQTALVYENTANERKDMGNFIQIKLKGAPSNPGGFGSKVTIYYDGGQKQYTEHTPYRGYLSTSESLIHFGIGTTETIDSILIVWPNRRSQILRNVPAGQILEVSQENAELFKAPGAGTPGASVGLFQDAADELGVRFQQFEHIFGDYNIQRLLPHQLSQRGPSVAVGDIDGDGSDDFFIGGSVGVAGNFYLQRGNRFDSLYFSLDDKKPQEDMGTLLFDADGDQDLDLYIVSGSYEQELTGLAYQDRLYVNDGNGNFSRSNGALPVMLSSGSCVKAADYDRDGDLDLFVGGMVLPGKYPLPPESYLLRNDTEPGRIRFTDVTDEAAPGLRRIGMVSDALWTDFDGDGLMDLMIAGEWMPITFFRNGGEGFTRAPSGIRAASPGTDQNDREGTPPSPAGWWNSLAAADIDNDGDMDYFAGNHGLNSIFQAGATEPMKIIADDFDHNGSVDAVIATYRDGKDGRRALYPVHARGDLTSQLVQMKKRFLKWDEYAQAGVEDLFSPEELEKALTLEATEMRTIFIENLGGGDFRYTPLPVEVQFAPVFGMMVDDYDNDGHLDLLLVGNDYSNTPFWGRIDALNGLLLLGDGKGNFVPEEYAKTGFFVPGDGKSLARLYLSDGTEVALAGQNRGSLKVLRKRALSGRRISLGILDAWAEMTLSDGRVRRVELPYGSTYLSQSSRTLVAPADAVSVRIFDFQGRERGVELAGR